MLKLLAWHFVGDTLRNGEPVPADNVPLVYTGEVEICKSGLHASTNILDALGYAMEHQLTICRVECGDIVTTQNNKFVCRERTILWRLSPSITEPLLRAFARRCALNVIHLWDAPPIVREYLETGDESLRSAAESAARSAAWAAARSAESAARSAWAAAGSAAGSAAWSAARSAAWAATRSAESVVWSEKLSQQNQWLTDMIMEAKGQQDA